MNITMILQKITSVVTLMAVFLMGTLGVFIFQATLAQAEENTPNQYCPMENALWVDFKNVAEPYQTESVFSETLEVINGSAYTLGNMRVAVAAYGQGSGAVPDYWTVLDDEYLLLPNDELQIPVEVNMDVLPAGEYQIKAFVMQGDEAAVLGAALRDGNDTRGVTVTKSGSKSEEVEVSLVVNGQTAAVVLPKAGPVEVVITTKNNDTTPLINSSMLGVLTQGSVPLGAAVWSSRIDSVQLVSGASRVTKLNSSFVAEGEYTVYAGLMTEGVLQPVVAKAVQIGGLGAGSWPYISQIGFSDYPLEVDSEVVTCIGHVGDNQDLGGFIETVGIRQKINTETGTLATLEQTNAEVDTQDYFAFKPGVQVSNFELTTDFFQQRYNTQKVTDDEETEVDESVVDGLSELSLVGSFTQTVVCEDYELCSKDSSDLVVQDVELEQSTTGTESFWFYAGVAIAAALLMFIIIRRLPENDNGASDEVASDELQ